MNPSTGHLVDMDKYNGNEVISIETGYRPVPGRLIDAARQVLNGMPESFVSMHGDGALSAWRRKKIADANRKRMARRRVKASRRANRPKK